MVHALGRRAWGTARDRYKTPHIRHVSYTLTGIHIIRTGFQVWGGFGMGHTPDLY